MRTFLQHFIAPRRVRRYPSFFVPRARGLALPFVLVALLGCGAQGDPTSTPAPGGSTGVPTQLVGTWRDAAATGSQVCDDLGSCSVAYGGSESYSFSADGHFVFAQQLEANLGGCRIVTSLYARGTVSVSNLQITLTSSYAHNTKTANCEAGFDKDLQIDPTSYTFRLVASTGRQQLYLTGASGEETGPYDLVP
ncbi:MAG: hypothetical protein JF589_10045 [Gemmatimonadetes bacterium]|nr:hypothetical protein [Gemmatimonadota bacterium]